MLVHQCTQVYVTFLTRNTKDKWQANSTIQTHLPGTNSKLSPQRALTPCTLKTNPFEHAVSKRNYPATNLLGRPPQHRQIVVYIYKKSGNNLLNSNHIRKTKQPALNLPTTEQQAGSECHSKCLQYKYLINLDISPISTNIIPAIYLLCRGKRKETQNQSFPQTW